MLSLELASTIFSKWFVQKILKFTLLANKILKTAILQMAGEQFGKGIIRKGLKDLKNNDKPWLEKSEIHLNVR